MELKEKLQILRAQMRMSQEELPERLNISRQSVTKWETGQSFPDRRKSFIISMKRYISACFMEVLCLERN